MEEKERFELDLNDGDFIEPAIIDTKRNIDYTPSQLCKICDLLNEQDTRIKELEEENNFLEKRNEELIIDRRDLCLERNDIFEENQQLKQTQKQQQQVREEVVEEIRERLKKANFEIMSPIDLYSYTDNFLYQVEKGKDLHMAEPQEKRFRRNQDKISFALEQLEKLKENAWQSATDISQLIDYTELTKIIDNQIKELKGKVKNE